MDGRGGIMMMTSIQRKHAGLAGSSFNALLDGSCLFEIPYTPTTRNRWSGLQAHATKRKYPNGHESPISPQFSSHIRSCTAKLSITSRSPPRPLSWPRADSKKTIKHGSSTRPITKPRPNDPFLTLCDVFTILDRSCLLLPDTPLYLSTSASM